MSIKVAIFSDQSGGVYVYTVRLLEAFKHNGFALHLLTHPPKSESESIALQKLRYHCEVHTVPSSHGIDQAKKIFNTLDLIEPDIIIPNYRASTYMACAILSKRHPFNIIGICHNDHKSYYDLLTRYEKLITTFICPTKITRVKLNIMLPHRTKSIKVIPHGVPLAPQAEGYKGGEIVLVYHGRVVVEQKNVTMLIDLVKILNESGIVARLKLIGSGPDELLVRDSAWRRGVFDRISFHGQLKWDEIQKELCTSHLAVLVSSYEGFCLSLAEAMGAGLPAIAFDCGGVIDDYLINSVTGYIVPFGDLGAMRKKIELFYRDPLLWKNISQKAREMIGSKMSMETWTKASAQCIKEAYWSPHPKAWPRYRPINNENWFGGIVERTGKAIGLW